MPAPSPVLELIAVSRRYRAGLAGCTCEVAALDRVTWRVERADCVGLVGGPGAGKTTLMLCAAGLLLPDSGIVRGSGVEFVSSLERLYEIGDDWRAVLVDPAAVPSGGAARDRLARRLGALRAAGAAVAIAARDKSAVRGLVNGIVTLVRGRVADPVSLLRTLELDVGMPRHAARLLAARLPVVRLAAGVLRVPLTQVSAEEVLSTCLALGVRVRASRVRVESYERHDRVAERG